MKGAAFGVLAAMVIPLLLIAGTAEAAVIFLKATVAAQADTAGCLAAPALESPAETTTTPDPAPPPASSLPAVPVAVETVLLTIRIRESGGDYTAHAPTGTASGAYQIVDGTWNNFGGYPHAWMAPPAIQDQKAQQLVDPVLHAYGLTIVPIAWYYPAALTQPELLDVIPHPEYGNTLTVRQYQQAWLDVYRQVANGIRIEGCNVDGIGGGSIGSTVTAELGPVLAFAEAQLGKPYVWGTSGPEAFDCSGLTLRAYQQIGITLPHNSAAQATYGLAVDWQINPIQAGDLIFHRGSIPIHDLGHVGIAINATQWIVAPSTGDVVSIRPIPFDRLQTVRRLTVRGPSSVAPSK